MYMYCEGQISCVMAAVMKLFFAVTMLLGHGVLGHEPLSVCEVA
jgi:hypothetical protein